MHDIFQLHDAAQLFSRCLFVMLVLQNNSRNHLQYGMDRTRVSPEGCVQGVVTKVTPQAQVMKHLQSRGEGLLTVQ